MKIEVTQDHIKLGIRHSNCYCPIALAIRDAVGAGYVNVGTRSCDIDSESYKLPLVAVDFIGRFDTQHPRPVEPFSFDLCGPYKQVSPSAAGEGSTKEGK